MNETILTQIIGSLTILLSGGLMFLLRRIFLHDDTLKAHATQIALSIQRDEQSTVQRLEDRKLRDDQRKEMLFRIDTHHKLVMDKLDVLGSR